MIRMNRTDVTIMVALDTGNADSPQFGLTIAELMEYISENGAEKSRMTVYRRLRGLVSCGYINKGVIDNHADTFYIEEKGKNFLRNK